MAKKDPRVDAYIARSAEFAKPILKHLRKVVHAGCPDVEETMKWSFPHFDYKGIMCGAAAFKEHCAFGFWKAALIFDGDPKAEKEAMGHFGRITSLDDLPDAKTLIGYVRKAAELNKEGIKAPDRTKPQKREPIDIPDYFAVALRKNAKARKTFEKFSPSHRHEYLEWVTEAKREETRKQRLATSIEWLSEGKPRHWKYQNCGT
ncbi:MAG: YdeI/OmpD-associated family protein [Verrucomicrobiota bacterium]